MPKSTKLVGRPKKIGSPSELKSAVDRYFTLCEAEDKFPDLPGMLLYLGITRRTMYRYMGDEDQTELVRTGKFNPEDTQGYRDVFEYAGLVRESWLSRRMAADGKGANGYMNLLKQQFNGGYRDRPKDEEQKTININLVGVGGEGNFK